MACVGFFLAGGALLVPAGTTSLPRVRALLDKYADVPMDYADATLVALADELDYTSVFTTDRTDFAVYRVKGGRVRHVGDTPGSACARSSRA